LAGSKRALTSHSVGTFAQFIESGFE
jgi:hypothetical protein